MTRPVLSLLAATVLAGLLPAVADAKAPIVAADPGRTSPIQLVDSSTYVLAAYGVAMNGVCLAFVNHGPRPATKVGLSLAMLDATGTVLGVEVMYPRGKFAVDQRAAFAAPADPMSVPNGNCHATIAADRPFASTFRYRAGKGAPVSDVAAILVSAREVQYDDGTAWRSDDVPKTGDHVALPDAPPFVAAVPAGPPVMTPHSVANAPVEVLDAYRYGLSGMGGFCVAFVNRDAREARRVRVALTLLDRNGAVAGVETEDVRGKFGRDVPIDNDRGTCFFLRGKWDADTFVYQHDGMATPIGRIFASPALVDFADGAAWQGPDAPAIGATISGP
jgi:hypothetical protein